MEKAVTEEAHTLVYNGEDEWDIEHPDGCGRNTWDQMADCGVGFEIDNNGLHSFFTDDPECAGGIYDPTLITIPGRYLIEFWEEKTYHWEYGPEYNSGINFVYPEEVGRD